MAGQDHDDYDDEQSSSATPWYNRTPALVGASVAGLAVIGILIAAVTFVARQFGEPDQAPLNYVDPTFSATASHSSPPTTTDINGPSSTTSSSSDTSSTDTTSTTHTAWTQPYTPPSGEQSEPSTTRRGPRTNVTRTLYP